MKHYIYITPEGTINWIEKMPEKPKDVINDGVHRPCVNHMIDIEYEAYDRYIEHEKTDSIPFEDQYRIRREIYYPNGNDIELDTIYPIELDADIQKVYQYHSSKQHYVDADWNDCTKEQYDSLVGSNIGKPRIVARIITKITSEL